MINITSIWKYIEFIMKYEDSLLSFNIDSQQNINIYMTLKSRQNKISNINITQISCQHPIHDQKWWSLQYLDILHMCLINIPSILKYIEIMMKYDGTWLNINIDSQSNKNIYMILKLHQNKTFNINISHKFSNIQLMIKHDVPINIWWICIFAW